MAKYPAAFETLEGVVRLSGELDFTDPSSEPVGPTGGTIAGPTTIAPTDPGDVALTLQAAPGGAAASQELLSALDDLGVERAFLDAAGDFRVTTAGGGELRCFVGVGTTDGIRLASEAGNSLRMITQTDFFQAAGCNWTISAHNGLALKMHEATKVLESIGGFQTSAITVGALPTVVPVSGAAFQCDTTRDVHLVVPCTLNPTAGAAATVKVEISPDNATFSTLVTITEPPGVALDGTIIPASLSVPAGWWVKLTATNAVLGGGTYY